MGKKFAIGTKTRKDRYRQVFCELYLTPGSLKKQWGAKQMAKHKIFCNGNGYSTAAPTPEPIVYCNDKIEGFVQDCVDNPGMCKGGNTAEDLLVNIADTNQPIPDWIETDWNADVWDQSYDWINAYEGGDIRYGGRIWVYEDTPGGPLQGYQMPYQELEGDGMNIFAPGAVQWLGPGGNARYGGDGCKAFACDPGNKVLFLSDFMNDLLMDAGKCHNV